jgi:NitT/TauT family transport system substrate-binding protein
LAASAQTKVNIGFSPAADFTPVFAAKDRGFFEKRGLDATLTRIPLASNIPAAIVSGSLQIGMGTGSMLVQTAEAGLGLVAITGASRVLKSNSIVSLVARSGENIKSAADLKGKKVGVPGLNSMLHVLFQKWLLDNKIPLAQVTMIEAPFPQMRDLLKGGTLDAAIAIEPFRARILSDNTGYKVADYVSEIQDDVLAAFWMTKSDWAQANPKAIQAFREAYEEALAWCVQNPEEARALQTKYLGVPSPVIPSYSTRISAADLELFEKAGRQVGMLRQPVDVSKLVWK